jgi:c-di-AMP phosphodiesterase-like protein
MLMNRSGAFRLLPLLLLIMLASGCTVIGGIFKAGFWTGIIVVVLIVVALVFLVGKSRG